MASHGLEARTPFLDKNVVATWKAIDTCHRRPGKDVQMEKQILREAFEADAYLPHAVLWRKKEAFSDGVSSTQDSWYLRCSRVNGASVEPFVGTHNPPKTPEAAWYRRLFEASYGADRAPVIPHMWMPRWIAGASDPSARTLKEIYKA
jgi:asparagine synthase (glutamine-hydrolysing)